MIESGFNDFFKYGVRGSELMADQRRRENTLEGEEREEAVSFAYDLVVDAWANGDMLLPNLISLMIELREKYPTMGLKESKGIVGSMYEKHREDLDGVHYIHDMVKNVSENWDSI